MLPHCLKTVQIAPLPKSYFFIDCILQKAYFQEVALEGLLVS